MIIEFTIVINISTSELKTYFTIAAAMVGIVILPLMEPTWAGLLLAFVGWGVAVGTRFIIAPPIQLSPRSPADFHHMILPVSVVAAGGAWLRYVAPEEFRPIGVLATGVLLWLAFFCQRRRAERSEGPKHPEELLSNLISYLTAFVLFVTIIHLGQPPLLDILIIGAISSVIAFEIFWWARAEAQRILLYSCLMGLFLAETAWGLNFWALGGISMGLLLLLFYYSATGIAHNHLVGKLTSLMVVEFAVVSVMGTVLLYSLHPLVG